MNEYISKRCRITGMIFMALAVGLSGPAYAKNRVGNGTGQTLIPGIWVDPDGCEHWVMDDGFEGYMTPHVTRDGKPVCGRKGSAVSTCAILPSDEFFESDSASLGRASKKTLKRFFRRETARAFIISGHTDSRASHAYNQDLSVRRANAVANIAQQAGVTVEKIRGFGEAKPIASNSTVAGQALNRRVEIQCIR